MSLLTYRLVKGLLLPPGSLLLLLSAVVPLIDHALVRDLMLLLLAGLWLMSLRPVSMLLLGPLERYPVLDTLTAPVPPAAQAIVILGAALRQGPEYGDMTLDAAGLQRVRYGAHLQRFSELPIYVTGGCHDGSTLSVGEHMRQALVEEFAATVAGVEGASQTTRENARLLAPMLRRDGIVRILLVSDALHLPRAAALFRGKGFEVMPAPTGMLRHPDGWNRLGPLDWLPSMDALNLSYQALHEYFCHLWYRISDWRLACQQPADCCITTRDRAVGEAGRDAR